MHGMALVGTLDLEIVVGAIGILLLCGICVLMARSKRPDGKMSFLLDLIDATQQNDDDTDQVQEAEPGPVHPAESGSSSR